MSTHIIAEIELKYKPNKYSTVVVKTAIDCVPIFRDVWNKDGLEYYEEFKIMYLNRANEVLGIYHHATGGMNAVFYDIRMIFQAALKANASSIIVVHNHPTGNLKPSELDIKMTQKVKKAGDILDITLLDSIILGKDSFCSMASDGYF